MASNRITFSCRDGYLEQRIEAIIFLLGGCRLLCLLPGVDLLSTRIGYVIFSLLCNLCAGLRKARRKGAQLVKERAHGSTQVERSLSSRRSDHSLAVNFSASIIDTLSASHHTISEYIDGLTYCSNTRGRGVLFPCVALMSQVKKRSEERKCRWASLIFGCRRCRCSTSPPLRSPVPLPPVSLAS